MRSTNLHIFQGNVQSMDVIVQGSVEVNDGHSYCMELVSQDGITTLTVACFFLQDYSINNTLLQVLQHI
jgi:hypothetical protein